MPTFRASDDDVPCRFWSTCVNAAATAAARIGSKHFKTNPMIRKHLHKRRCSVVYHSVYQIRFLFPTNPTTPHTQHCNPSCNIYLELQRVFIVFYYCITHCILIVLFYCIIPHYSLGYWAIFSNPAVQLFSCKRVTIKLSCLSWAFMWIFIATVRHSFLWSKLILMELTLVSVILKVCCEIS